MRFSNRIATIAFVTALAASSTTAASAQRVDRSLTTRPASAAQPTNPTATATTPNPSTRVAAAGSTTNATPSGTPVATPRTGAIDTGKVITIRRESFQYSTGGHRDPFVSLLRTSDIRPVITDLRLTSVAYDPSGSRSVVVLRDVGTRDQYRGKVGTQVGRMRIVRIDPKSVTFMIEEFGFSRQETLALNDSTSTRTP